jgi:hypothetical protein
LNLPQACNVTFEVKSQQNGYKIGDWTGLFSSIKPDSQN